MDLLEFLFRWVEEKVNKDKNIFSLSKHSLLINSL